MEQCETCTDSGLGNWCPYKYNFLKGVCLQGTEIESDQKALINEDYCSNNMIGMNNRVKDMLKLISCPY